MKIKSDMKKWIILILIAVFSYWCLNNLETIGEILKTIFNVILPFIVGGIIAFILNIPMTKIENGLKKKIKNKNKNVLIRTISIVLSLLLAVIIIVFLAFLLIPELIESAKMLINNIPGLMEKLEVIVLDLLQKYPEVQSQIEETFTKTGNVNNIITNILNYCVNGAITFIGSIVTGFITIITAIVFSVYMLSKKEYLLRGCKKIIYACLDTEKANKVVEIGSMTNKTFTKFISGQCVEAVILGIIMFIAFTIFRFPYALIISVITAIAALIPIFGAIIAMIIGAILIAITNPFQALIFIIVFLVIQQIEGNFIYPKVVGKSVGLSPMWTLLAVIVGGNLFGIVGMLIGLPLASVIYAIITSTINNKLKEKQIKIV